MHRNDVLTLACVPWPPPQWPSSSPVAAAGRVYITSRDGTTLVIRHADTFEVLATNKLDDDIDASAAIVGNEVYLRGKRFLYCLAESR